MTMYKLTGDTSLGKTSLWYAYRNWIIPQMLGVITPLEGWIEANSQRRGPLIKFCYVVVLKARPSAFLRGG